MFFIRSGRTSVPGVFEYCKLPYLCGLRPISGVVGDYHVQREVSLLVGTFLSMKR